MCKFLLLLCSVVSVIRWSLTGVLYILIIHVTKNCFSKKIPLKNKRARLMLEGKLYSKNNQFLFTLYNGHGRVCFLGPSVLLLHLKIGSVMWFEHKCSSWAVPVSHTSALKSHRGSALVLMLLHESVMDHFLLWMTIATQQIVKRLTWAWRRLITYFQIYLVTLTNSTFLKHS